MDLGVMGTLQDKNGRSIEWFDTVLGEDGNRFVVTEIVLYDECMVKLAYRYMLDDTEQVVLYSPDETLIVKSANGKWM